MQFCMVAMNLLQGGSADYIDTGTWSQKAVVEARRFGEPRVVWTGSESSYCRVPPTWTGRPIRKRSTPTTPPTTRFMGPNSTTVFRAST